VTRCSVLRAASRCAAVAVPAAAGSLFLITSSAAASTVAGTATVAAPGATARGVLRSGGASTPFTVALPANASCPSDTAHSGYHVYSYLVPKGTELSSVRFVNLPSTGYGLMDAEGSYYGPVNTAMGTGQIIGIPNDFEWGPLVNPGRGLLTVSTLVGGANHGVWEAGIACATTRGTLSRFWNTQVTFTVATGVANGFTWQAVPGAFTVSSPQPSTAAGAAAAAGSGTTPTASAATPAQASGGSAGAAGHVADGGRGSGHLGASGGATGSSGNSTPGTVTSSPAGSDVPVAVVAGAAVLALAAGLLLLLRRNARTGSATAVRGSVR
jgi:hypothetical protein